MGAEGAGCRLYNGTEMRTRKGASDNHEHAPASKRERERGRRRITSRFVSSPYFALETMATEAYRCSVKVYQCLVSVAAVCPYPRQRSRNSLPRTQRYPSFFVLHLGGRTLTICLTRSTTKLSAEAERSSA